MMEGYRRTMRPDLEQGQITHFSGSREFWDWLLVEGEADRGLPMIDGKVVTELNDYKGWTLKQFADALSS